jgi:hypothetical protein
MLIESNKIMIVGIKIKAPIERADKEKNFV